MSEPAVLVLGEALIDVVTSVDGTTTEVPGGSPLNVAVTLGRLDVSTTLVTALGEDAWSDRIERHLAASGVTLADGSRCLERTSSAVAHLQADGSARYAFDIEWRLPSTPLPPADVVHAGSLALFLRPGADAVRRHLEAVAGRALVSLDPNIRASLTPDVEATRAAFEQLCARAHLVKLSDEDAAWLYPGSSERAVMERLLGLGVRLVTVTRGPRGALLGSATACVEIQAAKALVADTIGAGDSFMGALLREAVHIGLDATLRGGGPVDVDDLRAVGEFASSVAALTVGRRGANPPRLGELG